MLHNPDSALYYEEMCLDIAQELHDTTWIISCMLGQYKTYSNITRFYEADDVHHAINKLPDERDIVPLEGNTNAYRLLGHSNYNFTVKNYTHTDVAYLTEQLKKVN